MPQPFFVPAATPETQEATYLELARWAGVRAPPIEERILAIGFMHDGEVWTATVGETLKGTRHLTQGKGTNAHARSVPLSDPALVLAIFPGDPYVIVTNHELFGKSVKSRWANPFLAGEPQSAVLFSEAGS